MKEPFGERGCHLRAHRKRSRRLAEDSHVSGIAAECRNLVMHPLQCSQLIEQAVIASGIPARFLGQLWMDEESEDAEAIIHGNDDNALLGENGAVLPLLR